MLSHDNWDMQCPQCDNQLDFRVYAKSTFIITESGAVHECWDADVEYDDGSACECAVCYHSGIVEDFRTSRQPDPEDLVV